MASWVAISILMNEAVSDSPCSDTTVWRYRVLRGAVAVLWGEKKSSGYIGVYK